MASPRPRPGIMEIMPYVGGKAHVASSRPLAKLSSNESALGPSPKAVEAYREAASVLHRYPDGACTALRQSVGRRFNIDPELVVCGAGSDELIALLARAYAGPGDEVLYSAHGFLMYRLAALSVGAHPVAAAERGLKADVDALLAAVTSRTRLVFLANPNNPTGSYLDAGEIARLHAGLPEDVVLVLDAAYAEFVREADYDSGLGLAMTAGNVVHLRTFSKLHGLAALRLGWMTAAGAVTDAVDRVRGPFNVSLAAQAAGIAALEDVEHQEAARRYNEVWLPWLANELARLGYVVHPSVANFVTIELADARAAAAAARFLEARGIIPRELGAYGLAAMLRISVGRDDENRRLIEAMAELAGGTG